MRLGAGGSIAGGVEGSDVSGESETREFWGVDRGGDCLVAAASVIAFRSSDPRWSILSGCRTGGAIGFQSWEFNSSFTSIFLCRRILSRSEFLYRNIRHSSAVLARAASKLRSLSPYIFTVCSSSFMYSVRRSRNAACASRFRCLLASAVNVGFRPPFRFGGGGIWFVGDSIENSELARMLEAIEKGEVIFRELITLSRLC